MEGVYLTDEEARFILDFEFMKHDCWICHTFLVNLRMGKRGVFLPAKIFDYGIIDHLEQILGRKVYFRNIAPATSRKWKKSLYLAVESHSDWRKRIWEYQKKYPSTDDIPIVL